jgi:putative transcriptional regulator
MGISYLKLRELLIEKKIKKQTLHNEAGLSNLTLAKINKDEYMDMESLEKIVRYIRKVTNENVDIGDIVEIKK